MASSNSIIPLHGFSDIAKLPSRSLARLDRALSEGAQITVKDVLAQGSMASVVGGSLGAAKALLRDGLDFGGKIPIDLGIAGLSYAGAVVYNSPTSLSAGNAAEAVFACRKVEALFSRIRTRVSGESDSVEHGTGINVGEDPILRKAAEMGV